MAEPQLQFTIPRPNTPVLKPNGQMRDEWFNFLVAITTNVIAAGGTVTHTGALVLNRLVVGNGLDDIRAVAGADGQIPIAATSDGTVQFQNITGTLPVVVTNSPHGIAISAPTAVTAPAGADKDIQYNDAGAFGGDANLTWDKTKQTETITGTDQESTLLIKVAGQPTANLGGNELGLSLGTHETGGVEIAEIANIGYFAFEPSGVATMGLSVGETPGSPTTYANYTEWDVTERTAELTGDPAAGAIPGLAIGAQANLSGSGASSTLFGQLKDGRFFVIWMDATGAMRYNVGTTLASIRPTEDNSVSDTSGSLFGSGSGSGSTLNVFARRGDDGRMGMPGSMGPQGPQGAIGPAGPAGSGGGVSMPFPRQDDRTRVVMIGSPSTSTPATSNPEVPIVVTTNSLVDTNFCWVVSESLEIAGGISLEIAGGARVEITGPTNPGNGIGIVLLEEHIANNSSTIDIKSFSSAFDEYEIRGFGIIPATNAVSLRAVISTDGGSTWISASNYRWQVYGQDSAAAGDVGGAVGNSDTSFSLNDASQLANASGSSFAFRMTVYNILNPALWIAYQTDQMAVNMSDGRNRRQWGAGSYNVLTAVNAIRFQMSSGSIAFGEFRLYGVAK